MYLCHLPWSSFFLPFVVCYVTVVERVSKFVLGKAQTCMYVSYIMKVVACMDFPYPGTKPFYYNPAPFYTALGQYIHMCTDNTLQVHLHFLCQLSRDLPSRSVVVQTSYQSIPCWWELTSSKQLSLSSISPLFSLLLLTPLTLDNILTQDMLLDSKWLQDLKGFMICDTCETAMIHVIGIPLLRWWCTCVMVVGSSPTRGS